MGILKHSLDFEPLSTTYAYKSIVRATLGLVVSLGSRETIPPLACEITAWVSQGHRSYSPFAFSPNLVDAIDQSRLL